MKKILTITHNQKPPYFLVWLFLLLLSFNGQAQTMSRPDRLFIQKGILWESWMRADKASEDAKLYKLTVVPIGSAGRYVRIQLPKTDPLSLAEVEVFSDGTNVALNKNTQQSSNNDASTGGSHLAVDGNTDGSYANGSVTLTLDGLAEMEPWWQVDIDEEATIDSIRIWNRTDNCCDQRLKGFYVFVSNTPFSSGTLLGTMEQTNNTWYTQSGNGTYESDHYPVGPELANIGFTPTYYERPSYNYNIHLKNPTAHWSMAGLSTGQFRKPSSFEKSNGFLNSLQLDNVNNLVSIGVEDEQAFSTDIVNACKDWYDIIKNKYPHVLVHNNQNLYQWSEDQLRSYMKTAEPDLLTYDWYHFFAFGGPAAGTSYASILGGMQKYRRVGLGGADGSGKAPLPYGGYLQGQRGDRGVNNNYYMSESELNIGVYSFLLMGAKWLNVFRYNGGERYVFTRDDGTLVPQYWVYANLGNEIRNLSPHLSRLRSTDVRVLPGQHLSGGTVAGNAPAGNGLAFWDATADPYVTGIAVTNLVSTTNDGLRGDAAVGYFQPIPGIDNTPDISMAPVTGKDVRYFMIMNGLVKLNGCCSAPGSPVPSNDTIQGKAALCKQSIVLSIDFKSNPIDTLYRVRRSDGQVEMVNLTHVSGTQYSFADTLDGGKGDLFYWKNADAVGSGIISGATYTLISGVNNSSVLDVTGGATGNGTPVQLYQSNSSAAQQWIVTSVGDGYYKLQPVNAPGKALDVEGAGSADGTKLQIWESNNTNGQKWTLTPAPEGGGYFLRPASAPGSSLDVYAAGTANGTKVQLWSSNFSSAQKWRLAPVTTSGAGIANMAANAALQHAENSTAGKVYPNPVTNGVLYVDLSSAAMSNSTISVIDITGKSVYSVSKSLAKGSNHIGINVATLSAGTYILQIKQNNKSEQYKFIIPKK